MKAFWSRIARELSPYVPGEQPRIANLVKLNTNESPFGPSPLGRDGFGSRRRLLPRELREGRRRPRSADAGADPAWLCRSAFEREFRLRQAFGAGRAGIRGGVARTCGAGAALQQAAHGALSAYHRRDGGRRATANRGGGAYPRA